MKVIKSNLVGLITFLLILVELIIGFGTLAIINIPRAVIPLKSFKLFLAKISNKIGDLTVYGLKLIMLLMHGNNIQIINNEKYDMNKWYMAMSNHQSWADIFVLLTVANKKIPLLKLLNSKREGSLLLSKGRGHYFFFKNVSFYSSENTKTLWKNKTCFRKNKHLYYRKGKLLLEKAHFSWKK